MTLDLSPLGPRDCPSGIPVYYPEPVYLAAQARYAAYDLPPARDDAIVIPAYPARVEIPVTAAPETPGADTTDARAGVAQIPRAERIRLAGRGVSVVVAEGPLTALPGLAYLAGGGATLPAYYSGTLDDAVGLADWATRTAYVRSGASSHRTLHEVGHLVEPLLTPAQVLDYRDRVYPVLRDYYGATTYFGANPSEALAESLARRWEGWPVPPAALGYFDGVFLGGVAV